MFSIVSKSFGSFRQAYIKLTLDFSEFDNSTLENTNHYLRQKLKDKFVDDNSVNLESLYKMISLDTPQYIKKKYKKFYGIKTLWIPASSVVGSYLKNRSIIQDQTYLHILDKLKSNHQIKLKFSLNIFKTSDSREPESAGVLGGIIGSLLTITICIFSAIPIGIFTAVFLEEYIPKGKFKYFLEVNINNLASVPSIVYGLLGLAIFINFFEMPRSSSLVGGLTLSLLILPAIIITTRQSIRALPFSIKQGALALGASPMQATMHHIIPHAMPGIITGAILSISRAIGETAPLIMLGMVAFISDIPKNFFDPSSVMPVLIYTWADSPEYGFVEKTSSAILVLIFLIVGLNYYAISFRNKYEIRS